MKLNNPALITEMKCGTNIAYVLNDNNIFFMTGYKVLKSQEKNGFLRCVKVSFNGKIQLMYLTKDNGVELKSLSAMRHTLDADSFLVVIRNLLSGIVRAKSVGFLHCPNIEVNPERIFVEPKTLVVNLIYLPIQEYCAAEDAQEFEMNLCAGIIAMIDGMPGIKNQAVMNLRDALTDATKSLQDIVRELGGTKMPVSDSKPKKEQTLVLNATFHPVHFRAEIPARETVLGASENKADIIISENPYISGVHAVIRFSDGVFTVEDVSRNGTSVNGKRLTKRQRVPLQDGDELRLATSKFRVTIQ